MQWKSMALKAVVGVPIFASGCAVSHQVAGTEQAAVAPQQSVEQVTAGKVVETMNSGGYTYVLVQGGDRQMWAAVPETVVAVGDEVTLGYGVNLKNFTSRTLARRFDNILFADGLKKAGEAEQAKTEGAKVMPAKHPTVTTSSMHAAPPASTTHQPDAQVKALAVTGKIVETMDSGGYTYMCLEKEGARLWAAVPTMKVTVGQDVSLQPGMEMHSFTSKTLQRTFDKIIFSAGPAM